MKEKEHKHRGRLQAQGERLQESQAWAKCEPLLYEEGCSLLVALQNRLTKAQLKLRKLAFADAKKEIDRAKKNDGITVVDRHFSKSFIVKGKERVDIEVRKGTAFI